MQIATSISTRMENDASHYSGDLHPLYPVTVTIAFLGIFLSVTSIIKIVKEVEQLNSMREK